MEQADATLASLGIWNTGFKMTPYIGNKARNKGVKNIESEYFKGVLHLLPKISMFCALSQNNQQLFENNVCILKRIVKNSKMALKV